MSETQDLGVVFDYPIIGGDTLYGIMGALNYSLSLNMEQSEFKDSIAHIGLDGFITLAAIHMTDGIVFTFKNMSNAESKIASEEITLPFPVVTTASQFVNFKEELAFLAGLELNTPIEYNYVSAGVYRKLKLLLATYGYGSYSIISNEQRGGLQGMKLKFYGAGSELKETYPSLIDCSLVAIISLPKGDNWEDLIIKAE